VILEEANRRVELAASDGIVSANTALHHGRGGLTGASELFEAEPRDALAVLVEEVVGIALSRGDSTVYRLVAHGQGIAEGDVKRLRSGCVGERGPTQHEDDSPVDQSNSHVDFLGPWSNAEKFQFGPLYFRILCFSCSVRNEYATSAGPTAICNFLETDERFIIPSERIVGCDPIDLEYNQDFLVRPCRLKGVSDYQILPTDKTTKTTAEPRGHHSLKRIEIALKEKIDIKPNEGLEVELEGFES